MDSIDGHGRTQILLSLFRMAKAFKKTRRKFHSIVASYVDSLYRIVLQSQGNEERSAT
jgi:hypothetical protein